jgi:hypothetical protein
VHERLIEAVEHEQHRTLAGLLEQGLGRGPLIGVGQGPAALDALVHDLVQQGHGSTIARTDSRADGSCSSSTEASRRATRAFASSIRQPMPSRSGLSMCWARSRRGPSGGEPMSAYFLSIPDALEILGPVHALEREPSTLKPQVTRLGPDRARLADAKRELDPGLLSDLLHARAQPRQRPIGRVEGLVREQQPVDLRDPDPAGVVRNNANDRAQPVEVEWRHVTHQAVEGAFGLSSGEPPRRPAPNLHKIDERSPLPGRRPCTACC